MSAAGRIGLGGLLSVLFLVADAGAATAPRTTGELFDPATVHTAHFTVAPGQWESMQPRLRPAGEMDGRPNGVALNWVMEEVDADLDFDGMRFGNIGLRYKGNGSFFASNGTLRMPMKADLNKNVKGQKLAGISTLNFQNNTLDPVRTNELLAYRLFRAMGVPAPRVSYARVYLTVAGKFDRKFVGLYSLVENVDTSFTGERFGRKDGAILKPSSLGGNFFNYRGPDWAAYEQEWDPKTDLTDAQKQRVIDFTAFINLSTETEFGSYISRFIDIDNFARYFATVSWIINTDGPPSSPQNVYLYLDPQTNRFVLVPWDHDDAWGGIFDSQDVRNTFNILRPWRSPHSLFTRLFRVSDFLGRYRMALASVALEHGRSEDLARQQDEQARILRPFIAEESEAALSLFDAALSKGLVPYLYTPNPTAIRAQRLTLKSFSDARERSVIDQLLEP